MASSGPASLSPSVQASSETLNMAEDDASADLSALDKEIDRMRKDIESMIENRLRESTKPESKRFRMAIVPTLEILARYTEIRDAKLSEVGTVSVPARLPAGCDTMRKDIESSWNVGEALRGKHRLQTILRFLRERIYALMEAKQLILQRARTMLHQEEKLAQFHGAIVQQFNSLQTSLDDLLARYDRLRIAEEMQMGRSKKTSKPGDKNGAASAAQAYTSASPLRDPVELGDLKVYASHLARFHRSNRDFDTFRSRIAHLTSTDLEDLIELVQVERDLMDTKRRGLPRKDVNTLEFLHYFEELATWFPLSATIDLDDGRPFAHAVDKLFAKRFTQLKLTPQSTDLTPPSMQTMGDMMIQSLESDEALSKQTTGCDSLPIKVVKATWIDSARRLFGEIKDIDMLAQKHERLDFQLRYEYDILASDSMSAVRDHLRMTLRYYTDASLSLRDRDLLDDDASGPMGTRQRAASPETGKPGLVPALGMLLPKTEGGVNQMVAKRQHFSDLQKAKDDSPSAAAAAQLDDVLIKSPDVVSTVFAPHEIHAYLELRYIKARELRMTLLRQLNFFRSVERRLVHDLERSNWSDRDTLDPMAFDTGAPIREADGTIIKPALDLAHALETHTLDKGAEDRRLAIDRHIYISNNDGENVIYDISYQDLATLEGRLLRMASAMISRSAKDAEATDDFFMQHARSKLRDHRDFMDVSFNAPEIDRQQILLELLSSQVELNDSKINLVNAMMEVYEHVYAPSAKRALSNRVVQVMAAPRAVDPKGELVSGMTVAQIKAYEAQERLVVELLKHAVRTQSSSDWGSIVFHHAGVPAVHISEFMWGLDGIPELQAHVEMLAHDLHIALVPHETVSPALLQSAVWQRTVHHWIRLATTAFQLPETPRKLLFQQDLITRPETFSQLLADQYTADNSGVETIVHPTMGHCLAASPDTDPNYAEVACKYATSYSELLDAYRRLKGQWLETHWLHQSLRQQAASMGVSFKLFCPNFAPLPFDLAEMGDLHTQSVDLSDDEDAGAAIGGGRPTSPRKEARPPESGTPLAVSEFDASWGNIVIETDAILRQFMTAGSLVHSEALRIQVVAKYVALAACETNAIIYNRVREKLNPSLPVSTYSGDFSAVGFFPNSYRRQLRRHALSVYQTEWKKVVQSSQNPVADKALLKSKALAFYAHHMSQLLQEQISRIHLIKIQRQMPAKFLGAPPQSSTGALQASNNAADTPGAPPQGNSVPVASEDNAIAGEVLLELDRGKNVRLWTSVQPLEILALYHATKFADSEYGAGCSLVFSKLFQGYSMLLEILRLSYAVGHHLNERGDETLRQQLLVIKKEINNFTSPIPLDKLVTYLHLRWSILRMRLQVSLHAAAYCLLGNPMLHPSMSSFFAMYHYYRRLSRYPHSGHALVCSTPVEVNFQSNSFSDLSLTERKLCTERLNEIESHLDDIFHQTNLESISIETALVNQVEFLKSTSKIMNMRFELLSVVGRRQPVKLSHVAPFLATYKAFVTAPAYKEFVINQRRKGSHVEDVNATRGAQIEFEKCQTAALRNTLLVAYTRSIMRCLRRVFDLMADERSDSLFNNRDAIVLPRPYLIHAYPVELREGDFAHKSTLFDDFSYELHAYSQQTLSLILQAMRDRGRILADERGALVEVDAASVFLVRREYLATALAGLSNRLASWNQGRWKEIEELYSSLHTSSLDLLSKQRATIESFAIEQALTAASWERDVRLGASIKSTDVVLELSTIGSELNELKKSRRTEEKMIRNRVRAEYDELVNELSSQIHKLKARFNEFRINSIDEVLTALSEVKKDDLLSFIGKDYHKNAETMGQTIIGLQESIDDIRSDNAELKQVMSKLKSMYALKSVTSKSAFAKRIARLIEEKRIAEERLWDNFRETDAREQVLRKTLGKCQRELVSVQTQYESLKRALKEEQRSKELLQKALSVQMSENKTAAEISSIRRVETFTRFEFERLLQENKRYSEECLQLRVEVARLQGILQAQEWRQATKQRLRLSPSRPTSPTARQRPTSPRAQVWGDEDAPSQELAAGGASNEVLPQIAPAGRPISASVAVRQPSASPISRTAIVVESTTNVSGMVREEILLTPSTSSRPATAKRETVYMVPPLRKPLRPQSAVVSPRRPPSSARDGHRA